MDQMSYGEEVKLRCAGECVRHNGFGCHCSVGFSIGLRGNKTSFSLLKDINIVFFIFTSYRGAISLKVVRDHILRMYGRWLRPH